MSNYNYEKAWEQVHEQDRKGLPESAIKVVNEIYQQATKDGNSNQLVKAIIHKLKFVDYKEENSFVKNIITLQQETETATFPAKPLLHSMLGEMYWQYYANNRYLFHNRSQTVNFNQDDIQTWNLQSIIDACRKEYLKSLENPKKSKGTDIAPLSLIITGGNEKGLKYRPTLFDFLAHRALDFFSNQEADVIKPNDAFTLDKEEYMKSTAVFSDLKIVTTDTTSTKFQALLIFQDLIRFHQERKDIDALVDVDLRRLGFVRQHAVHPLKNMHYEESLLALEKSANKYPISTQATFARAQIYQTSGYRYDPLRNEEHKWDLKKAYEICQTAIDAFPKSDGAIQCGGMQFNIRLKSISIHVEENNVIDHPFRALVEYRNFTKLHYRIIKTSRQEVKNVWDRYTQKYGTDKEKAFLKEFLAKEPLKTGNYSLPDDGDYQSHKVEVKLDPLPAGEYMVLFSHASSFDTNDNGLSYGYTVINNISYITRNMTNGSTEVITLHRDTGNPIPGVKAEAFTSYYESKTSQYQAKKLGTYSSDQQGKITIPYFGDRHNFWIDFYKDDDFSSTKNIGDNDYGNLYQYPHTNQPKTQNTFFFLDRRIYRPGQTIYFKGLVISRDEKKSALQKGHTTTLTLLDVNHQPKQTVTVTTSEYGTYSGTFTAPSDGLMGQMSLRAEDGSGSTYFTVEEYKRPKFEVNFEPITGTYELHKNIKVTGIATAFSGAHIDGAKVSYRVVRNAIFPYWWWCRWGYYPTSPSMEITSGSTETNENGNFEIHFDAIPDLSIDKNSDPTFSYTVYADVTDINGETHSAQTYVSVGYKSLTVGVPIVDINKSNLNQKEFTIQTSNLSGTFEPAKGHIRIVKLKSPEKAFRKRLWSQPDKHIYSQEEYYSFFPVDLYADETNVFKWAVDKEIKSFDFNTAQSKTFSLEFNKWELGQYKLEINALDKNGKEVKGVTYFKVFDPTSKKIPIPEVDSFYGIKLSGEPGEQASFALGTLAGKINVLYELELDDKVISTSRISLNNEQQIIKIPITEAYRGNVGVHYTYVKNNRLYNKSFPISVPHSDKVLDISFGTFRSKLLPGQQEEWRIKIRGHQGEKVAAEMVATLYDASLDEFASNDFHASFLNYRYNNLNWSSQGDFESAYYRSFINGWNPSYEKYPDGVDYNHLNWFGYSFYPNYRYKTRRMAKMANGAVEDIELEMAEEAPSAAMPKKESAADLDEVLTPPITEQPGLSPDTASIEDLSDIKVRSNFNETAFFYPHLMTNPEGEIIISFTIPEALTRWKMLGFAHTQDLKSGYAYNSLVTQKDLMVVPNQPRFFRENDHMTFTAKISSLIDEKLNGIAQLEFFDAFTDKPIDMLSTSSEKQKPFSLEPKRSTTVAWDISIPEGVQAISYRIVAKAGNFSDGEEMVLPVVTNRMLVTESLPLPIRGNQSKTFTFDKLVNNKSTTLRHHRYTLEFTSNPAWYAIQALPYLMEYPYTCIEQTFSKYYANSIASHIANSHPKIKKVFDTWRNIQPSALLSNLEKNQELKSALLEETPWVLQAQDESQRKRMVGVLFDLNRMANEQDRALAKIAKAQYGSGGFSWFPNGPEDRYMTQHIIAGMGHLDVLGVKTVRDESRSWNLVKLALGYLDNKIKEDYDELKRLEKQGRIKLNDKHIGYIQFHYLYLRSYFKDLPIPSSSKDAFDYFLGQAKKYWLEYNLYVEGMACLALHRFGVSSVTEEMIKSFKERALHSEEMGMYWKNTKGYYWYQAPIETQALMIEVFDEVAKDTQSVEALKVWLLKQKQTQDWQTTKATTEACYALLRRGTDLLMSDQPVEIKVGDQAIDPKKIDGVAIEAGTGYFKTSWSGGEITSKMGNISLNKKDKGVAWGAVYWQYFEQLDKITPAETGLQLKKQLFIQKNTKRGPVIEPISNENPLQIGDLVKVRIELRADRNLEYVHLKDMRAAGFEPVSTLSQYKYQDGLGYYESPRDLATNFFIGYLSKGTYVFEYDLRVSQKGNFSNGITTIQCMYAPEFTSHSEGIRININ